VGLWLCAGFSVTLHQQPRLQCRCIGPKTRGPFQTNAAGFWGKKLSETAVTGTAGFRAVETINHHTSSAASNSVEVVSDGCVSE